MSQKYGNIFKDLSHVSGQRSVTCRVPCNSGDVVERVIWRKQISNTHSSSLVGLVDIALCPPTMVAILKELAAMKTPDGQNGLWV